MSTPTVEILLIVNFLVRKAFELWEWIERIKDPEEKIPQWDEIVDKNAILQAKIDEEMGK